MPQYAESIDQTLLLDVHVNGHSIGKVGEFTMRDGELMALRSELHDLGFQIPLLLVPKNSMHGAPGPGSLVALSDVPGLIWNLDPKTQELNISAPDALLLPTLLQVGDNSSSIDRRVIESGKGVTLNYDIVGTSAGGQIGTSGSLDLQAFSPWGVVSLGWLGYIGAASSGADTNVAQVGNLGVLNFSMATSMGTGHSGAQFSLGVQRIGRVFSLGGLCNHCKPQLPGCGCGKR